MEIKKRRVRVKTSNGHSERSEEPVGSAKQIFRSKDPSCLRMTENNETSQSEMQRIVSALRLASLSTSWFPHARE